MSWWNIVTNAMHRQRDVVVAPHMMDDDRSKKATLTDASWVTNPQFGSPRRIDFSELEEYETDITVQAAANFIIDSVATSEWDIIPDEDLDTDEIVVTDATDAIKFFNSEQWEESFETVLRGMIADILMYDCGVMVLTFPEFCYDEDKTLVNKDVTPLQLRARDGRSFIKQVTEHGDIIKYWQYSFLNQATRPVEFDKAEIIYVQERPSTRSPYGTSKLEVVKNVTDLMMATQVGHRSEQENALQIGGVINHPDVTDAERLKHLSVMYNAKLKGEHNKNAWLVTGGNVDINPIDANISDNSWISGSEFYQQQILAIFKVPKTVLGITSSDTNRATAVAQSTNFKRMGVSTMLSLIERVLTREIVKKYFGETLLFRFVREVDLTDEAIRADIDAKNVATGIRTVNELRMRDGLEEIEEPEDDEGGYEFGDEFGEFEGLDSLTSEESEELGKGLDTNFNKTTVHVPASGGRIAYSYERTMQERHTDNLLAGVESIMDKREAMMQAGDVVEGVDPAVGKKRREVKATGREILLSMDRKQAPAQTGSYTAGMKELVDRGDIEKKKSGKGYKLTKQGKARVKAINELALRAVENVPIKQKDVNKSGGTQRIWIPPSSHRIGHWREIERGSGDDKADDLKTKIGDFQSLGDTLKKELKTLIDKFTAGGMTPEGKEKVMSIKSRMDAAYTNRDAAIKAWEKHTGKKWTDKKPADKKTPTKVKPTDKKERKPLSEGARANAAESRRLKAEIDKYQAEGDAAKSAMDAAEKKYAAPGGTISPANQKKIDALESKMEDVYDKRDAAETKFVIAEHKKLVQEVKDRISLAENTEMTNDVKKMFIDTGEITIGENTKNLLSMLDGEGRTDDKVMEEIQGFVDRMYSGSSVMSDINTNMRDDWLDTSNGEWGGILKDSIQRLRGNEIQHHDAIDLKEWDTYAKDSYKEIGVDREDVDKFVSRQMSLTSAIMDAMHPDSDIVTLYRGTSSRETSGEVVTGSTVGINQNPVSSWSNNRSVADMFGKTEGGVVLSTKVNKKDIYSTHYTMPTNEKEYLMIGDQSNIAKVVHVE